MRINLTGFACDAKDLRQLNRHSGMLLAGIQARAATGFLCGWIPDRYCVPSGSGGIKSHSEAGMSLFRFLNGQGTRNGAL
jgi:hypothetical protein